MLPRWSFYQNKPQYTADDEEVRGHSRLVIIWLQRGYITNATKGFSKNWVWSKLLSLLCVSMNSFIIKSLASKLFASWFHSNTRVVVMFWCADSWTVDYPKGGLRGRMQIMQPRRWIPALLMYLVSIFPCNNEQIKSGLWRCRGSWDPTGARSGDYFE